MTTDITDLVRTETSRLADVLDGLDEAGWTAASLCAGWSVRDLTAHLLMPYELSVPSFLLRMLRARFDFDAVADRLAREDPRDHRELVAALRTTPQRRFNVPGAPAEAPLSHLVIHAEDVYRPLGLDPAVEPRALDAALAQSTRRPFVAKGLLDGLTLATTDSAFRLGDPAGAAAVGGPARALLGVVAGRPAGLAELTGPGVERLRERLPA